MRVKLAVVGVVLVMVFGLVGIASATSVNIAGQLKKYQY
jgi:hypothetical protein